MFIILRIKTGALIEAPFILIWGAKFDGDFRISDLVKNPDGTDI